jgi:hypothetical protein
VKKSAGGKFDALIEAASARPRKCHACNDEAHPAIAELLGVIKERKVVRLSVRRIYEILGKTEKGFAERVGYDAFRKHIAAHEPLWLGAK